MHSRRGMNRHERSKKIKQFIDAKGTDEGFFYLMQ